MLGLPEAVFRSPLRFDCGARTCACFLLATKLLFSEQHPAFDIDEPCPRRQLNHCVFCEVEQRVKVAHFVCGWSLPAFPASFPLKWISGARSGLESDVVLGGLSMFFDFACILSGYKDRKSCRCRRPRRPPQLLHRCRLVLPLV